MQVAVPEDVPIARALAHEWLAVHWETVRTLPSKNYQLDKRLPDKDDLGEWHNCLKRVLMETAGLTWKPKKKGGTRFTLASRSLWSKLGINIARYADWYSSPEADTFGVVKKSMQCCVECNGAGDYTLCVRQEGMWRCVNNGNANSYPHRKPFHPLDVSHGAPEEETNGDGLEEKKWTVLDTFMTHIGFAKGTVADEVAVTGNDMQVAWRDAVVQETDKLELMITHGVDLDPILQNRGNMGMVRRVANVVLQRAASTLSLTRSRYRDGPVLRSTYLIVST
jgi:hypothetical protein